MVVIGVSFVAVGLLFASGSKEEGGSKKTEKQEQFVEKTHVKNIKQQAEDSVDKKFGNVVEVVSAQDLLSMIADNTIVLVKFHAPWCGFCRKIEPFYVDVASKFGDVLFLSVNIDDFGSKQEVQKIVSDVTGLPTIKLYKKGTFVEAIVGGTTKDKIAELVQKHSK